MTRPVTFSEDGARRIIAATKAVEAGNRNMPPVKFRQVGDDGGATKVGKTTEVWVKGSIATIDLWESGTPPDETHEEGSTLGNCVNRFENVPAERWVVVCQATNGYWYLVEWERGDCDRILTPAYLSTLESYDATQIQVLGHEPDDPENPSECVAVKWLNVTDCDPPPEEPPPE